MQGLRGERVASDERKKQVWATIANYCVDKLGSSSQKEEWERRVDPVDKALAQGKVDEAVDRAAGIPARVMKVVEALVGQGQTEKAMDVFRSEAESKKKQYSKTLATIAKALIKEGRYDETTKFFEEVTAESILVRDQVRGSDHMNGVAKCLAEESKDPERVREFVKFLEEEKFVNTNLNTRQSLHAQGPDSIALIFSVPFSVPFLKLLTVIPPNPRSSCICS